MAFKLNSISITRNQYQKDAPFLARASISHHGAMYHQNDEVKIEVQLDEHKTLKLLELFLSDLVVQCQEQIGDLLQDARDSAQPLIEAAPKETENADTSNQLDDDIPF